MELNRLVAKSLNYSMIRAPHLPKDEPKGASARHPLVAPLILSAVIAFFAGGTSGIAVSSRAFDRVLYGVPREDIPLVSARRAVKGLSAETSARAAPAVVALVRAPSAFPVSRDSLEIKGAGFFVSSDGWVATHASALAGGASLAIATANGELFPVRAILRDPVSDLAFVRVKGDNFPVLSFDDAVSLSAGSIVGVGRPLLPTVQSAAVADPSYAFEEETALRTAERMTRGFLLFETLPRHARGAPVVTERGAVAGMVISVRDEGAVVLPARAFTRALRTVLTGEKIARASLGVSVRDPQILYHPAPRKEAHGVAVAAVRAGSPAARGGIQAGDVLLSIDGESVSAVRPLPSILAEYAPGDKVKIRYRRGGEEGEAEVALGATKPLSY